ncbi:SGNH/GDSL hydrolase family protein [Kaistia algarum]|uniref:SGNH/GDSL hydrolase family protein n=1 Tax=Kaistia algarum TaxID=2083279 RepID=UPI0014040005|nr:SGNH family hydrolase [Kaistia algarum]MCX5514212.1 DUF459 domain-containing protein [Kaistia algarum]
MAAALLVADSAPAMAQFRGPTNFLDRLFGRDREVAPPADIPSAPQRGTNRPQAGQPASPTRKKQPAQPSEPPYAVLDVQPKNPDAKKVLVVGDFMASGLAWGLDQAFAEEPRLAIVDRSEGASGFVRDDRYDWSATLPELLSAEKPDMIVVMIGSNDRQSIRTADGKFAPRSEEWQKLYQQRVERFLLALQTYGKPVYWVGEPPIQSADSSADMAFFNTIFKGRAEAVGANFVDIWDGFANEDGQFVSRGPDVDGQTRQLRSGDGINFTKSGRRKLAFYVEREIRQDGGFGPAASAKALLNPNETTEIGPDGKARVVGPIVSLTDPAPGAADVALAGAPPAAGEVAAAPATESFTYKLTVNGEAPPAPPGRADDFAWKPPHGDEAAEGSRKSVIDGIVILPAVQATPAN